MDPYASTFLQIVVAALALGAVAVASGGVGDLADAPAGRWSTSRPRGSCTSSPAGRPQPQPEAHRRGAHESAARHRAAVRDRHRGGHGRPAPERGGARRDRADDRRVRVATRGGRRLRGRTRSSWARALMWALSPCSRCAASRARLAAARRHPRLVVSVVATGGLRGRRRDRLGRAARGAFALKVLAGVLVALATWGAGRRSRTPPSASCSRSTCCRSPSSCCSRRSSSGRHVERVTPRVWAGAGARRRRRPDPDGGHGPMHDRRARPRDRPGDPARRGAGRGLAPERAAGRRAGWSSSAGARSARACAS